MTHSRGEDHRVDHGQEDSASHGEMEVGVVDRPHLRHNLVEPLDRSTENEVGEAQIVKERMEQPRAVAEQLVVRTAPEQAMTNETPKKMIRSKTMPARKGRHRAAKGTTPNKTTNRTRE